MLEMRACLFITSRDKVAMRGSQQLQQGYLAIGEVITLEPLLTVQHIDLDQISAEKSTRTLKDTDMIKLTFC